MNSELPSHVGQLCVVWLVSCVVGLVPLRLRASSPAELRRAEARLAEMRGALKKEALVSAV